MREIITNYIRAGYAGIYIISAEEARVEVELKTIAKNLKYGLHAWSVTEGIIDTKTGAVRQASDPMDALNAVKELPDDSIVLLRDFQGFLDDANPVLVRMFKDVLRASRAKGKAVIVVGCRLVMPPELEREIVVVDYQLPGKEQLGAVLDAICESGKIKKIVGDVRDQVLDAASGLTSTEAENAFALSIVETGKQVSPVIVAREKANTIKKNGLLEIVVVQETLESIGGLDVLKDWLMKRRDAFSQRALEYKLPSPKGLLIIGIPGTGKSLTAKATASVFGRPLLKLDAGKLFAGLVGQSEGNLRAVIQTAEAIAPCILWVDEIEKGLSGSKSSNSTDGGTSARVFGSFISWMQEKKSPVFIVATANDVSQLPPELLRKGRFDECFFVDLPNEQEREAIWRIQIQKYGRDAKQFNVEQLARATQGLTGAEIEQAFIDALYAGFAQRKEPDDLSVSIVLNDLVPLSRLMGEQISALREWSKGRARCATASIEQKQGRRIAA